MSPERRSRAADVEESLLNSILDGVHPPGSVLPSEAELAGLTGVSRLTLREAIKALTAKRVLTVRHGTATRVNPLGDWNVLDPTVLGVRMRHPDSDPSLPHRFLEARRAVEVAVAELAALRRSASDLDELELQVRRQREANVGRDVDASVAADVAFHTVVMAAAGNPFMAALLEPFGDVLVATRRQSHAHSECSAHAVDHHARILEALRSGDPTAARLAMDAHMQQTHDDMHTYLGGL
ncbi:MAG: FadR/GntR family transcriptional regulator, partial [Janthinobacterium lividum]